MNYFDALAAALVIGLASASAWRFLAVDVLTRGVRGRLPAWARYWWGCPWCMGAWITAAITIATDQLADGGLPVPLLVFAAARYVTGWVGSADPDYQDQTMRGES